MSVALSALPEPQPVDHPTNQTNDDNIRIRVQSCDGGYGMFPHAIIRGACKELAGARLPVFLLVWEMTVSFYRLEVEIPFARFLEDIAAGERTIREAIRWLDDNDWLTVKRNGGRPQIYGIPISLLEEANCIERTQEVQSVGGEAGVAKSAKPNPPVSIYRFKEKKEKEPLPTPISGNIPVCNEVATSGSRGIFFKNYKKRLSDEDIENLTARLKTPFYEENRISYLLDKFQMYKIYRGKVFYLLNKYDVGKMFAVAKRVHNRLQLGNSGIQNYGAYLVSEIEKEPVGKQESDFQPQISDEKEEERNDSGIERMSYAEYAKQLGANA